MSGKASEGNERVSDFIRLQHFLSCATRGLRLALHSVCILAPFCFVPARDTIFDSFRTSRSMMPED
jgi:hypothetical protein